MKQEILVGCDPELFVRKDGALVSGYGLIPGTKSAPHPVDKGAVQVDGMALEFNIDPARHSKEFITNIKTVLQQLHSMIPGYDLAVQSVANFGEEYMKAQPEAALELGCDPDWNAYTGAINDRPDGSQHFRTAAGHVHIGWTEGEDVNSSQHMSRCMSVVKQLDVILGVPSILFDKEGGERRKMYGKAGAFRPKPYGVEYRPLSNKWIGSDSLMEFVFNKTVEGVSMLMSGKAIFASIKDAEDIINTSDEARAMQVCEELGLRKAWGGILNMA